MSQTLTNQTNNSRGQRLVATIVSHVAPIALAMIAGYGGVKFAQGTTQQRLRTLENQSQLQQQDQQRANDRAITREEFKLFVDSTREDLREIKTDVRAILNKGR